jgi:hypothetical protein
MRLLKRISKFLKRKPEEPSVDRLINALLHDESNDRRHAAAVKIGELRSARAVPALYLAAKEHTTRFISGFRTVQSAAIEALGEIGGPEAIEALVKLIRLESGYGPAGEALKKLGFNKVLRKYLRFRNQKWGNALILDENGNLGRWEFSSSIEKPRRIGPGDYVRVEYSIAEVKRIRHEDGRFEGIPFDTPNGPIPGPQYLGIVDLEARELHLESAFDGFSTIDLAGDPMELLPGQKKAFVRLFRKKYHWFRVTEEVKKLLQ